MGRLTELERRLGKISAQEARIDEEKARVSQQVIEELEEIDKRIVELQKELSSLNDQRRSFDDFLRENSPYPGSSGVRRTRQMVLDFLQDHPDSTATEISRDTQLNEPTVQAQLVRALKDLQVTRSKIRPFRYRRLPREEYSEDGGQRFPAAIKRSKRVTLHEEIRAILLECDEKWLSTRQLADRVNERRRYRKKDGSDVTPYQIHGRTRQYSHLFEQQKQQVRLLAK